MASIRQRSNGTWQLRAWDRKRNKSVQKTITGSFRDAQRAATALQAELDSGTTISHGNTRVKAYLERWFNIAVKGKKKPSTVRDYESVIRAHLIPGLGHFTLWKLQGIDIQEFYAELETKMSSTTAAKVHRVLHSALKQAFEWKLVPSNEAATTIPPVKRRFEPAMLTADDLARVIVAADKGLYADAIFLAITTGMRLSEIRGLRWQDVDVAHRRISIRQGVTGAGKHLATETPKSGLPRVLRITPATAERLSRIPRKLNSHLVFPGRGTEPLSEHALRGAFYRALVAAGLPEARFHDIRHAHASTLIGDGKTMKAVSDRLGHSNIGITMDLYSHMSEAMREDAIDGLDALLGVSTSWPIRGQTETRSPQIP